VSRSGERRLRLLQRLVGDGTQELDVHRLCGLCRDVTAASGAGIMLISGDELRGSPSTTDDVSAVIERLQFDLGEGPCVDAHQQGRPVLEPDLAEPATPRWLAFAVPAVDAGARAVFAFPLRVGAIRLGSLDLHCDQPRSLSDTQHADALVMADITAEALLVMQAGAPPGMLAAELDAGSDFRDVVHQASGMVAAQLEVDVGQALVRLRAFAFGNDRHLADVARDVVARRLRFDVAAGEADP
jgi:hypothetical protein